MRIALMDPYDTVISFLDNDVPKAMHYSSASLRSYLAGDAYTMTFTVATDEPDSKLIREGCKISFRAALGATPDHKELAKDYYLTIVKVDRDEDIIQVEAWGLTLELTNEEVGASNVPSELTIDSYLNSLGFEKDVLTIDASGLSGEKRRIKFDGRDTILHRIYALAEAYDAEAGFEVKLKPNGQLDRIHLVFYKAGEKSGMGQDRTKEIIRYGSNVSGIKKTADISGLFTGIRPRGKSSKTKTTIEKTTSTYPDGKVQIVEKTVVEGDGDQRKETRTKETIGSWSQTRVDVRFKESDGRETVLPTQTFGSSNSSKPKLSGTPTKVIDPKIQKTEEKELTLSGFDVTTSDANGTYLVIGEDLRCPEARDRFPASLAKKSDGSFQDGYIIHYLETSECEDQGSLYTKALKALQENCVPKVSYQMTGYVPGNVGDWVLVEDAQYDPPVYLQCRIVEQDIDLCEPWNSSTTFDNFTTIESQISSQILSESARLAALKAVYDVSISSKEGTVFEEEEGIHTFTAAVRDAGIDVTDSVAIVWSLNGEDIGSDDSRVQGKSIRISGSEIDKVAVLGCRAIQNSINRGSCEITLQAVYIPTIDQIENEDGSITIVTEQAGVVKQSTLMRGTNGKDGKDGQDGISPTAQLSKSGKVSTLKITDKNGTKTTTISDGADGKNGEKGDPGFSPSASVSKSGNVSTFRVTDQNGTTSVQIRDGADGKDGTNGQNGQDGVSPIIGMNRIENGVQIVAQNVGSSSTATVYDGAKGDNGVSPTVTASKSGKVTTVQITDVYGIKTATINDGTDGKDGEKGDPGFSPVCSVERTDNGVALSITDAGGLKNILLYDGEKGEQGVGITNVTTYFYRSSSSTYPTNRSSFTTTRPTLTSTYKYLYMYDRFSLSNGSYADTPIRLGAVYGDTGGKGDPGKDGHTPTVALARLDAGVQITVNNDGSSAVETVYDGAPGGKGEKGDTGNGISSVTVKYYQSSSSTAPSQSSSSWSTSVPTPTAGYYLHTQIRILMTNGASTYFYLKNRNGSNGTSPTVVNNLTSTSTTSALSAAQGKALKDEIENIKAGLLAVLAAES